MLTLTCQERTVGHIRDEFLSDGTWFGVFQCALVGPEDAESRRLRQFVVFCEEWNERARAGGADAAEFDAYSELIGDGIWRVRSESGETLLIENAPVFFKGGDITWRIHPA
jgi:hypothetical protein